MCGQANTNDNEVYIYLGYYGCELRVNNLIYRVQGEDKQPTTKDEMTKHIMANYSYEQFIEKILECIDNGEEG